MSNPYESSDTTPPAKTKPAFSIYALIFFLAALGSSVILLINVAPDFGRTVTIKTVEMTVLWILSPLFLGLVIAISSFPFTNKSFSIHFYKSTNIALIIMGVFFTIIMLYVLWTFLNI